MTKSVETAYVKVKELHDGNLSDSSTLINSTHVTANDSLGLYVTVKGSLGTEVKFDSE